MKYGAITIQNQPYAEVAAWWRALEAAGVETLWIADHLVAPRGFEGTSWSDAYVALGALATQTSTARIGTLVTPITFRHAAAVALAARTVDDVSGGRFELGVGAGGAVADHELVGVEVWEPRERARRLSAFVDALVGDLGGVPLTVAGGGRSALRACAAHATRWVTFSRSDDPAAAYEDTRERNARLDELCAAAGRDPATLTRSLLLFPSGAWDPFASVEALRDLEGRAAEVGVDELVFYWPVEAWYASASAVDSVLAELARSASS